MAQSALKPRKPASSTNSKPSHKPTTLTGRITKKGARKIAPKNATLIKQQKITKKASAGLTAKTEKMLGERAGHLEMLGQGKKQGGKGKKDKATGRKEGGSGQKG